MSTSAQRPVIFLAFANDRDDTVGYLRNLPDEARRLREVLEPAERAGLCEIVVRSNCTAADIFKAFQDSKYRHRIAIFHYGGHANGYQLLLESADGKTATADGEGLAGFLAQQNGLQLVFLNGCSTGQHAESLLAANVSAVLATSIAIDDQVATNFATQFYQGLAGGTSIRAAYHEATSAVQTASGNDFRGLYFGPGREAQVAQNTFPWNLYPPAASDDAADAAAWSLQDAASDPLWNLPQPARAPLPASPFRYLERYEAQHAELFFGRSELIRELYDALTSSESDPVILFYGQSGVGKSSVLEAGVGPRLAPAYEIQVVRRKLDQSLQDLLRVALGRQDQSLREVWRQKERQSGKPLIIVLDQVEEIYTRPLARKFATEQNPDATDLTDLIHAARSMFLYDEDDPKGKLVLSFRKEWLSDIEDAFGKDWSPQKISARPLRYAEIAQTIVGPSTQGPSHAVRLRNKYKLVVENEVAGRIADLLLSDPDSPVAPMLQIILNRMWEAVQRQNRPTFTVKIFESLNIRGDVLGDFLSGQLRSIEQDLPGSDKSGLLLDIMDYHTSRAMTASERSEEETHADYGSPEYPQRQATVDDLIRRCMDAKLLTIVSDDSETPVQRTRLIHDTLAPRVNEQVLASTKPGQNARRLLMLKTQDELANDLLTIPQLRRLQKGRHGTRNYSPEVESLIRRSQRRMIMQSVVVGGLFLTLLFGSWVVVGEQKDRTIAAKLESDSYQFNGFLLNLNDESRAIGIARRTINSSPKEESSVSRRRAAMILAKYEGDEEAAKSLLLIHLDSIKPPEMQNLQAALQGVTAKPLFSDGRELSRENKAKLAAILLSLGRADEIPKQWYLPVSDPSTRTCLINDLLDWTGDEETFASAISLHKDKTPEDLKSVVYAAISLRLKLLSPRVQETFAKHLIEAWRESSHAGVRGAAFAALRACDRLKLPVLKGNNSLRSLTTETLAPSRGSGLEFERRVFTVADSEIPLDFVLLQMPDFDSKQTQELNGVARSVDEIASIKAALLGSRPFVAIDSGQGDSGQDESGQDRSSSGDVDSVRMENYCKPDEGSFSGEVDFNADYPQPRSLWIGATEVSQDLMSAFRAEHSFDDRLRIAATPEATFFPARNVSWQEAIEFCNWLTMRDPELGPTQQCYIRIEDSGSMGWRLDTTRTGYRLPTKIEWKFACRAWSTQDFWFGRIDSDVIPEQFHNSCVWSSTEAMGRGPLESASLLPNAFGFFDMHGNVREMRWTPDEGTPLIAMDGKEYRRAEDGAYDVDIFEALTCETEQFADDERNVAFGLRIVRTIEPIPPKAP